MDLRKQAVITKCRGYIYAEPSRVFLQKAVDFRAKQKSVIICANLWTKEVRPQMVFIDHRLTQIETDCEPLVQIKSKFFFMLRDYQIEICERVREAFARHRSVMVQMPTGTGKTVVLAELVREYLNVNLNVNGGRDVLIVAHRRELVEQIQQALLKVMGAGVARELPTQQSCDYLSAEGAAAHIAVHSIQWLSRNIEKVKGKPGLVIVDEAHHALAKTYKMMWEAWPEAKFLGLTATPWRMSGEGFTDLFEVMVQSWSVKRFIAEGWLCAYDYYAVRPDSDDQRRIDSLTKRGTDGDYQTKEMREKLDDAPCIERLFETYMQHAKGMKGIVYAIDIEHAEHIADYYKQQGVAAYAISSKTSLPERKRLIEAFRKRVFLPHPSSPARRGSTSLLNPPLLRRGLQPVNRLFCTRKQALAPAGLLVNCLRNRVAIV